MRMYRTVLGLGLAVALAFAGSIAYASHEPQGFKGGYEISKDVYGYGYSVAAVEKHPELKSNYHERMCSSGVDKVLHSHIAKGAGYVLREVQPFSASSIRPSLTS